MVGLEFFFPPFLTFYRFTRTAQWYFVKGVDLKVPHTNVYTCIHIDIDIEITHFSSGFYSEVFS